MATVVRNPDATYTVTLTAREDKILNRWGDEMVPVRNRPKQLEAIIGDALLSRNNDYVGVDEPKRREKFRAATDAVQAQVDALLGL
jgi:endonuclease I